MVERCLQDLGLYKAAFAKCERDGRNCSSPELNLALSRFWVFQKFPAPGVEAPQNLCATSARRLFQNSGGIYSGQTPLVRSTVILFDTVASKVCHSEHQLRGWKTGLCCCFNQVFGRRRFREEMAQPLFVVRVATLAIDSTSSALITATPVFREDYAFRPRHPVANRYTH
jgi:hypothetical protein